MASTDSLTAARSLVTSVLAEHSTQYVRQDRVMNDVWTVRCSCKELAVGTLAQAMDEHCAHVVAEVEAAKQPKVPLHLPVDCPHCQAHVYPTLEHRCPECQEPLADRRVA